MLVESSLGSDEAVVECLTKRNFSEPTLEIFKMPVLKFLSNVRKAVGQVVVAVNTKQTTWHCLW